MLPICPSSPNKRRKNKIAARFRYRSPRFTKAKVFSKMSQTDTTFTIWKGRKVRSSNELLTELRRLNRTGVINDEEFLILRKIIAGGNVSPEFYRKFDRLFAGNSKIAPVEAENKKNNAPKEAPPKNQERLYSMAEAINELNLKLTALGGFDHSRELLSCPACGMFEDVSAQGKLITAEADYPEDDTGLRFKKLNEDEWECPDCGHLCRASSND
jgi:hypothetical protein